VSQRLWWDEDQLPYYELICDDCGASFTCYDDSCYDWALLRDAALCTGWDTRSDQPDGPHRCPNCQRLRPASRPQARRGRHRQLRAGHAGPPSSPESAKALRLP
jgi:hypothetical protein